MKKVIRHFTIIEETVTIGGVEFTKIEMIATIIELDEVIDHNVAPTKHRPVVKPRWWAQFNTQIVEVIAYGKFADATWLHIPASMRRLLRWCTPPRKREANIIESFDAEKDYREFGTLSRPVEILERAFTR
jgi:hypothetical protein